VSPRSAERLCQVLPAKLVLIEGAGHLPYEECPEEFNRAVTDFLWTETHI
jgi:pimeloyl-ACP methyl ester carboxylesterase